MLVVSLSFAFTLARDAVWLFVHFNRGLVGRLTSSSSLVLGGGLIGVV